MINNEVNNNISEHFNQVFLNVKIKLEPNQG